ncbi:helix-turn-helix domain-containing protein [Paenibacillus puerhi]|uniref:helix-turn-helix domain-containing protein n=1 Tax=Paenibacillus puerhi TaxID=2692622 RepID=UPI0019152DB0|nr:hypothetical protein [Paenibacillus puerhi]
MEEKKFGKHSKKMGVRPVIPENEAKSLTVHLLKAKKGDKESLEVILCYFEEDIELLLKFINLPKEDGLQTLKLALIESILKE